MPEEAIIDKWKLFEMLGYTPHSEAQKDAHNATERFRIACCGRRWGKSTWAGHEMTYKMFVPNSVNWIVGPDYSLGEKEFRVVFNDFKKLGLLNSCKKSYNVKQGNMRLEFTEFNSICEVKSAERPDSLVGEGLNHVCMSEAAKHLQQTWQMYVEPGLSDRRGTADFPSTPEGFNWYKGLYDVGHLDDVRFKDYTSWRFPTWTNQVVYPGGFDIACPNIIDGVHYTFESCKCNDEIVRLFNNVSEMFFLQEIAAEFTAFQGMIYPEFNEMIHVQEFEYNPQWRNWWSLDFGYTDPFVCLDIMIDHNQRIWVWREYMESYKSTQEHGIILKNRTNPDGFHVDAISADPRGADEIATLAFLIGSIVATPAGWVSGVEAIKSALKVRSDGLPGLIIHPRCTELIRQLKSLRKKATKEGQAEKPGQHDYDDHGPDALRYFFNEFFVHGAGMGLGDIYNTAYKGSEAAGFFTHTTGIKTGSGNRWF